VCVAVGIGPGEALLLDAAMFDALEREAAADRARWTVERELAATTAEIVHAFARAYVAAHTKKGHPVPQAWSYPRPGDDTTSTSTAASQGGKRRRRDGALVLSPSEFASMFGHRVEGAG